MVYNLRPSFNAQLLRAYPVTIYRAVCPSGHPEPTQTQSIGLFSAAVRLLFEMAKTHRSKPHQIRLSETGKPHELTPEDWFQLTGQGIARVESDTKAGRVAVLRLPFVGWIADGVLCVSRIGASIKSTWLAWEREWWFQVETIAEAERLRRESETFEQREARVQRERETAAFIEALEWQSTKGRKVRRNSIRWVSPEQLRDVLSAFRRLPEAAQ